MYHYFQSNIIQFILEVEAILIQDMTMLDNCYYHKFVLKHPKINQN